MIMQMLSLLPATVSVMSWLTLESSMIFLFSSLVLQKNKLWLTPIFDSGHQSNTPGCERREKGYTHIRWLPHKVAGAWNACSQAPSAGSARSGYEHVESWAENLNRSCRTGLSTRVVQPANSEELQYCAGSKNCMFTDWTESYHRQSSRI